VAFCVGRLKIIEKNIVIVAPSWNYIVIVVPSPSWDDIVIVAPSWNDIVIVAPSWNAHQKRLDLC